MQGCQRSARQSHWRRWSGAMHGNQLVNEMTWHRLLCDQQHLAQLTKWWAAGDGGRVKETCCEIVWEVLGLTNKKTKVSMPGHFGCKFTWKVINEKVHTHPPKYGRRWSGAMHGNQLVNEMTWHRLLCDQQRLAQLTKWWAAGDGGRVKETCCEIVGNQCANVSIWNH